MEIFVYPDDDGKPPEGEGTYAIQLNLADNVASKLTGQGQDQQDTSAALKALEGLAIIKQGSGDFVKRYGKNKRDYKELIDSYAGPDFSWLLGVEFVTEKQRTDFEALALTSLASKGRLVSWRRCKELFSVAYSEPQVLVPGAFTIGSYKEMVRELFMKGAWRDVYRSEFCLRPSEWTPTLSIVMSAECGFCVAAERAVVKVFVYPFIPVDIGQHMRANHMQAYKECTRLCAFVGAATRRQTRMNAEAALRAFVAHPVAPEPDDPDSRRLRQQWANLREREAALSLRERAVHEERCGLAQRARRLSTLEEDFTAQMRALNEQRLALDHRESVMSRAERDFHVIPAQDEASRAPPPQYRQIELDYDSGADREFVAGMEAFMQQSAYHSDSETTATDSQLDINEIRGLLDWPP